MERFLNSLRLEKVGVCSLVLQTVIWKVIAIQRLQDNLSNQT